MRSREGRTEATTREPGDLPRRRIVPGRGVPVVRLHRAPAPAVLHASARPLPPTFGVQADVSHDRNHARHGRRASSSAGAETIGRAGLSGHSPQRRRHAIRSVEDRSCAYQGVSRRRGRRRRRVAPRARHRRWADEPGRRGAYPSRGRGAHLPYRGCAGPGRACPDARRASQGRPRLCALSRGARPRTRQGERRRAGGGVSFPDEGCGRIPRHDRRRTPRRRHRGGLRRT